MKIMLAEDDKSLLMLAEMLIQMNGHQVLKATEAGQVLELARQEQPDLILLDLNLPGGDGVSLLGELKSQPLTQNIAVIIVSGAQDPSLPARLQQLGAVGFLAKPWQPERLLVDLQALAPALPWSAPC